MAQYANKPKSAPARLKSKYVKNRTNAMKEIEAWVRKDDSFFPVPEASRMSGQLSDNVTEERMLKAKLWELSKERYKFLSQNSYEKKMFQDRQQKKAGQRRISSASSDTRLWTNKDEAGDGSPGKATSSSARPKPRNARLALLERLDPTKGRSRSKSVGLETSEKNSTSGRESNPQVLSRNTSRRTLSDADDSATNHNDAHDNSNNNNNNSQPGSQANCNASSQGKAKVVKFHPSRAAETVQKMPAAGAALVRSHSSTSWTRQTEPGVIVSTPPSVSSPINPAKTGSSPQSPRTPQAKAATPEPVRGASPSRHETSTTATPDTSGEVQGFRDGATSAPCPSWAHTGKSVTPCKYGMRRVGSFTSDPRYSSLERTLCPLVRGGSTSDVTSIVSTMESLHVRPKTQPPDPNRSRTKIEVKAMEFMRERGFVF